LEATLLTLLLMEEMETRMEIKMVTIQITTPTIIPMVTEMVITQLEVASHAHVLKNNQ